MPFKLVKFYSVRFNPVFFNSILTGLLIFSSPLFATVTVVPETPYTVNSNVVFYASTSAAELIDTEQSFKDFNFSKKQSDEIAGDRVNRLQFDVLSDTLSGSDLVVVVFVKFKGSTSEATAQVPIATVGETDCGNQCRGKSVLNYIDESLGYFFAANYTEKKSLRIGIYLRDMCFAIDKETTSTQSAEGCTGTSFDSPLSGAVTSVDLTFKIGTSKGATSAEILATGSESTTLTVKIQNGAAALSCPSLDTIYFPGDGEISLSAGNFKQEQTSGFAPIDTMIIVGNKGVAPDTSKDFGSTSNEIRGRLAIAKGGQSVSGFTNTTDGSDNKYNVAFSVRDAAGVVSPFLPACALTGVQTSTIQGFLTSSNCFIATAAFGDKNAAPVLLLREFRDKILLKLSLGKRFVHFYYQHSPPWAEALTRHPIFRIPVLHALLPLQIFAWIILNPIYLLLLFGVATGISLGVTFCFRFNSFLMTFLVMGWFSLNAIAQAAESPSFIDSVKEKMEKEGTLRPDSSQGYTEKSKQRLLEEPHATPSSSFIEQEKIKLGIQPEERESAILAVQEGRSELKAKRSGEIQGAFGFKLSASADRNVVGQNGVSTGSFEATYGNNWVPDFGVTYEYQPFHSELIGNFGLIGGAGVAFQSTTGQFQFNLINPSTFVPFGSTSQTQLSFYTVPVFVGLNFRLNLMRLFRPYVQACPTAIFFLETRSDSRQGNRGYSRGLLLSGGLNILMDWIFQDSAWSVYEEMGFKHSFLTIDYTRLTPLVGDVRFSHSIYSAGMTYEF